MLAVPGPQQCLSAPQSWPCHVCHKWSPMGLICHILANSVMQKSSRTYLHNPAHKNRTLIFQMQSGFASITLSTVPSTVVMLLPSLQCVNIHVEWTETILSRPRHADRQAGWLGTCLHFPSFACSFCGFLHVSCGPAQPRQLGGLSSKELIMRGMRNTSLFVKDDGGNV